MMTVRPELHLKFAEENEMSSFLLSAKSGDQIKQAFFKIAALLAGLLLCYSVTLLHGYTLAPCTLIPFIRRSLIFLITAICLFIHYYY